MASPPERLIGDEGTEPMLNPAQIALQKALIRQLQSILGACKGMLGAWETYVQSQEQSLAAVPSARNRAQPVDWRQ